jgi:GrpB-like predicted nucleotidyltransferase (UPF0157 family)
MVGAPRTCCESVHSRKDTHYQQEGHLSQDAMQINEKPIVDMLVEVTSLEEVKLRVVPILESKGYDYFWRPTWGDDVPPWYAWFIRRNAEEVRTHHIHMVESHFEHWDRLLFRDYLVKHPAVALEYQTLKLQLAAAHPNDRVAYTKGKTEFIAKVMESCHDTR